MSYRMALGESSSWWGWSKDQEEIYLVRTTLRFGTPLYLEDSTDVLLILRAFGDAGQQLGQEGLDIKGVAVQCDGDSQTCSVDVVYWYSGIGYERINAEELSKGAVQLLQANNPGTTIVEPGEWLELTGPKEAIEFWYALPIAYMADRGMTDTVASERRGAFLGTADFVKGEIPPAKIPPIPIYIPPDKKPKVQTCGPGPGKCPDGQICCSIFAPGGGIVGYCATKDEGCGIAKEVPEYSGKAKAESHWGVLLTVAAFTAVIVLVSKARTGARNR